MELSFFYVCVCIFEARLRHTHIEIDREWRNIGNIHHLFKCANERRQRGKQDKSFFIMYSKRDERKRLQKVMYAKRAVEHIQNISREWKKSPATKKLHRKNAHWNFVLTISTVALCFILYFLPSHDCCLCMSNDEHAKSEKRMLCMFVWSV